ncbi:MAG: DUF3488 and DUF4129 domain-containing transglutaminase family protein [Gammaproteobacteria bacterium]
MSARAGTVPLANTAWASPPITEVKLTWALVAMMVTTLPFVNDVPAWIIVLIALTMTWRYVAFRRDFKLPHVVLRMGWAFANFGMVFFTYRTINGLQAGTALLLLMSAMKLTETARSRDLIVIVYMAFFNVVAHALFDQNIVSTLYGALSLFVVVAALIQVTRRTPPTEPRRVLSRSGMLLAQALPLTLLIFVLFPRVPGPFWALPTSSTAMTGISDTMEAGNISQLLESGAVAFRAEFDDELPPSSQRYWRGPVLDTIIDNKWSAGPAAMRTANFKLGESAFRYMLTLEPHQRRWVFALDLPSANSLPPQTTLNADLELLAHNAVKQRQRFRLRSHPDFSIEEGGLGTDRRRYVNTRNTDNPRTAALAELLRARYGSNDNALIQAVLDYFGEDPFAYTLRPPPLRQNASASDQFLFGTQRGFCEHYASSFALLMRYANIPARVVTGYQGGERNPLTGHLTIRQSDAHAWTEVWLDERGWVRVDPTGAVAPERVERGINGALGDNETLPTLMLGSGPFLSRIRHGWDAVNASWNRHILGYGQTAQRNLMRRLGLDTGAGTMVAILTATCVGALGLLALWLSFSGRIRRHDPIGKQWATVCARLARIGLAREPHEGPLAYAARVADRRPDLEEPLATIANAYVAERFGPRPSSAGLSRLQKAVGDFRPTASASA